MLKAKNDQCTMHRLPPSKKKKRRRRISGCRSLKVFTKQPLIKFWKKRESGLKSYLRKNSKAWWLHLESWRRYKIRWTRIQWHHTSEYLLTHHGLLHLQCLAYSTSLYCAVRKVCIDVAFRFPKGFLCLVKLKIFKFLQVRLVRKRDQLMSTLSRVSWVQVSSPYHGSFAPSFSLDKKRSMQSSNPTQLFFWEGFLFTLSCSSDSYESKMSLICLYLRLVIAQWRTL